MNSKRLLGIFVFGILIVGLFSGVVSAQGADGAAKGIFATLFDTLFGGFGSGGGGGFFGGEFFEQDGGFAKLLLFSLVALVVYSIASFMPFIGEAKGWVSGGISIIIAILATFFLSASEISAILFSYKALGIVITGIIPFLAIAGISKKAVTTGHVFLSKFLWVAFLVVLFVRFTMGVNAVGVDKIDQFGKTVYSLLALATLTMLVIEKKLWRFVMRRKVAAQAQVNVDTEEVAELARLNSKMGELRRDRDSMISGGYAENYSAVIDLDKKIKAIEKKIAKLT